MKAARLLPLVGSLLSITVGWSGAACQCGERLVVVPGATDQIDVFEQKLAAKVDILWVVDNSESMLAEQSKVAGRFNQFFNQLITSQVDYHIGVVTTDPAENGVLRGYAGPTVTGCTNCRFVTKDVPCPDPAVDISGLTDEGAIENALLDGCPAQLVFRKLVTVGAGGSSFEQGFTQAAVALGVADIDETGVPRRNPPAENADFIRDDAALYIVFVSDEDEGAKADGSPVRYYQRLFESLKGAGNENKVAIAAITGYPADDASLPPLEEVCPILETTFDGNATNDDPRAASVKEALREFGNGCFDEEGNGEPADRAETGGRYIELACRTGGVVANMCKADYSSALDALGANAAGLLRKFCISRPEDAEPGPDGSPFSGDEGNVDCDDDGKTDGAVDASVCVKARGIGTAEGSETFIPQDQQEGWVFEASTSCIRFEGRFLPAPGSKVEIRYKVKPNTQRNTQPVN